MYCGRRCEECKQQRCRKEFRDDKNYHGRCLKCEYPKCDNCGHQHPLTEQAVHEAHKKKCKWLCRKCKPKKKWHSRQHDVKNIRWLFKKLSRRSCKVLKTSYIIYRHWLDAWVDEWMDEQMEEWNAKISKKSTPESPKSKPGASKIEPGASKMMFLKDT